MQDDKQKAREDRVLALKDQARKKEVEDMFEVFDEAKTGKVFMPVFKHYLKTFGLLGMKEKRFIELFGDKYYDQTWLDYRSWIEDNFKEE